MNSTSLGSRLVSSAARSPGRSSTGPEVWRRLTPSSCAMMCDSVVLPSPGGPNSSTWSSASPRFLAASMKIDSWPRIFSWPTYSSSARGRSARSTTSSCTPVTLAPTRRLSSSFSIIGACGRRGRGRAARARGPSRMLPQSDPPAERGADRAIDYHGRHDDRAHDTDPDAGSAAFRCAGFRRCARCAGSRSDGAISGTCRGPGCCTASSSPPPASPRWRSGSRTRTCWSARSPASCWWGRSSSPGSTSCRGCCPAAGAPGSPTRSTRGAAARGRWSRWGCCWGRRARCGCCCPRACSRCSSPSRSWG